MLDLLTIADTHGGLPAILTRAFKAAKGHAKRLSGIATREHAAHRRLHRNVSGHKVECDPGGERAKCVSTELILVEHFGMCRELEAFAGRALVGWWDAWNAARDHRPYSKRVPGRVTSLPRFVAFMHDDLGFQHVDTAFLRVWYGRRQSRGEDACLPLDEVALESMAVSVRRAYLDRGRGQRKKHPTRTS